jgi:hypothetical protein
MTTESRPGFLGSGATRGVVVIADAGDTAAVIVIRTDELLEIGSRFQHDGATWRITGRRPHSRALIASPLDA